MNNRTDGSIGLLQKFFELIVDHSVAVDQCIDALDRFTEEFSDMRAVSRFKNSFDNISYNQIVQDCGNNLEVIINFNDKITNALISRLNPDAKVFLVYSNSKTIQLTIQNIPVELIEKVYVMRSNPGGEGLSLFNNLKDTVNLGSKLALIDDEEGFRLIKQSRIEYLLLGCDHYFDDWFVNKIGTSNLIEQAITYKVSIFVLTQIWKKSLSSYRPHIKSDLLEIVDLIKEINLITD